MIQIEDLIKPYHGEDEISFTKRKAYFYRMLVIRSEGVGVGLKQKVSLGNAIAINPQERERIDNFWNRFLVPELRDRLVNYTYYDIYKKVLPQGEDLTRFLPDSFYQTFVDEYFTNPQHSNPCDDKNLYDVYFHDVNRPKTLFRKSHGLWLDADYNRISPTDAIKKACDKKSIVVKKTRFSWGGKGLLFWNAGEDDLTTLQDFVNEADDLICQEEIVQHSELSRLNPSSVNTVRIMTMLFQGQVYALSSVVRMGINGSRTDNASSGGIVCGINPNGQLKNVAFDTLANQYPCHPQGTAFESVIVPNFDECTAMVKKLAQRFSSVSRLISWDIAIDQSGHPLLIECNLTYGQLDFHQYCNGPIFGDLTEDVIEEVFANSYTLNSIIKSFEK